MSGWRTLLSVARHRSIVSNTLWYVSQRLSDSKHEAFVEAVYRVQLCEQLQCRLLKHQNPQFLFISV